MYLERIKNKLGSTNSKISTGNSKTVKKLARKKGGSVKRSKHATGGDVYGITPSPAAVKLSPTFRSRSTAKLGYDNHKKGKRVKREHHFLGAMLGALSAASAIPGIIDLVKKIKR